MAGCRRLRLEAASCQLFQSPAVAAAAAVVAVAAATQSTPQLQGVGWHRLIQLGNCC
eukprot:CAMPEP_0172831134 /NCGR_PEP_ID=MMETSP1075-20121228/22755_1 /TAXON_ID=2916 /ORGANISM="Ceratium fusus, Strain PA161109" /LENGTH=56 /DNA_ID=CAMNT_0013673549 /DNA_START=252 /DNA_END=422 /DNA_ORIENTATION=-